MPELEMRLAVFWAHSAGIATNLWSLTIMTTTPATTVWVQQEIEKAVAPLRQQIDELDDWSNGVFAVLADLLPLLLKAQPDIAAALAPLWRDAAVHYDRLDTAGQAEDFHETQALLEARKILYRRLDLLKAWPAHVQE